MKFYKITLITIFIAATVGLAGYGNRNRYANLYIEVTATVNPADLADGAGETIAAISVPGAMLGDYVVVAAPYDLQDLIVTAYVQAANVVEIRIQNENAGANVNLASDTWKIRVIK